MMQEKGGWSCRKVGSYQVVSLLQDLVPESNKNKKDYSLKYEKQDVHAQCTPQQLKQMFSPTQDPDVL